MKTIIVVFTSTILNSEELRSKKHYAWNTESEVKVGDMLNRPYEAGVMQVVKVLDVSFTYYHETTGELSNDYTSTRLRTIKKLVVTDIDDEVVMCTRVPEKQIVVGCDLASESNQSMSRIFRPDLIAKLELNNLSREFEKSIRKFY